jgi:hypothetical protein
MAQLPHPIKTWWQYGIQERHYSESQMIEYGQECANEARKEYIDICSEHAKYKEREKTMGWNQS